jgi:hypothetical protein
MFKFDLKRAVALMFSVIMAVSLAACSGNKTEAGGGSPADERIPAALTFRDADGAIIADNSDVKSATAQKDGSDYSVLIKFTDAGKDKFAEATARLIGQPLSIYLDDEELMSPIVQVAITNGEVTLVGDRVNTKAKAEEIADAIKYGRKPSEDTAQSNPAQSGSATKEPAPAKPANYSFTEILPPKYDEIEKFSEGMAAVRIGDKWGYIDENGVEVIPVQYDSVFHFSDGLSVVISNLTAFFIDKTGNQALTVNGFSANNSFSEGLASISQKGADGYSLKFGFMDRSGAEVIPCVYDGVTSFADGLSIVSVVDSTGFGYKFGVIDKSGVIVVEPKYAKIDEYTNGMSRIISNNLYGFIDKSGNEVVPPKYEFAGQFNSEGYAVVQLNKRYGVIDAAGKEVIPPKYDSVYTGLYEGLAAVEQDGKVGFVDGNGNEVIPLIYDALGAETATYCYFSQGLAPVSLNGRFGFIDKSGKEVIPFQYDEALSSIGKTSGLAHVRVGGSYGFIDKTGKEVVPIKYAKGSSSFSTTAGFSNGLAGVALNGKYGFVDIRGKEVTEFKWEAYRQSTGADGIIFVADGNSSGKKWGLLKYTAD